MSGKTVSDEMMFATPFGAPMYIMPKPVGSTCNMGCAYCYYLEKNDVLYGDERRHLMSEATLEVFVREYIAASTTPEVVFTWHGGEATMRPVAFYRRAMELQQKYGRGRRIVNCFQTNGTLLNDEWCEFFKANDMLVGVSIDGPQEFHDEFRRMKGGGASWHKVMQGINLLKKHGVEWNAMAVVNDFNVDYPLDFYRFFKEIGCEFIQFTPIVERTTVDGGLCSVGENGVMTDFSIDGKRWGRFLNTLFDEWVRQDIGKVFVQIFDATLANYMGVLPGICTMARQCGHAGVMEYNGDVYCCDHFVFPEYKLGNIHRRTLIEMMTSEKQRKFGRMKQEGLPGQCLSCRWLNLCNGECPKNRFAKTSTGEAGLNYLCEGYRMFFEHTAPFFELMKAELEAERAPANIMSSSLVKELPEPGQPWVE